MSHKAMKLEADAIVARNIRIARMSRNVSQTTLAKPLGVTFQQIQKYEKGANRVSMGRLVAIAKTLGAPLEELLAGIDSPERASRPRPVDVPGATRDGAALAEAFNQIACPRIRQSVVELVESLADDQASVRRTPVVPERNAA